MGCGSARERRLGLAAVKEYNGAADFAVVTGAGLVNPMSGLTEDLKRGQTDTSYKQHFSAAVNSKICFSQSFRQICYRLFAILPVPRQISLTLILLNILPRMVKTVTLT